METNKRIVFAGPSGIGKTTLAKLLSEELKVDYISGSISDLLPDTKNLTHQEMLSRDPKELQMEDYKIMNLRNKLFSKYKLNGYISDRSFLDSAAYFIYKQASKLPTCELVSFLDLARDLTIKNCDYIIVLDFPVSFILNWSIEDNNKRILNDFFQCSISKLIRLVLEYWGVTLISNVRLIYPSRTEVGIIRYKGNAYTKIILLQSDNLKEKLEAICNFIKYEKDL
jgi:hypothetical protein|nr:MAG TPA: adenylate kinase [Caudoviricetes sp.]